jgi:hypothetical protein
LPSRPGDGRPPEDPTTSALIERLDVDKSLRRILGWERRSQVPSEATFSRAFAEFARGTLPDKIHAALIERALGGRIIGAIARDATEIEAREKPVQNKANDGKDDPPAPDHPPPPRKRGRLRKDEQRPKPEPTRLERQVTQNLGQMLADLPTACDVGCKKNSKGYKETWIGYKLHIDVACGQIPFSCVLTSASVHDSQVAIPLMTMTSARVSYLYDLMDAAYDAAAIHDQSRALGHAPIVDRRALVYGAMAALNDRPGAARSRRSPPRPRHRLATSPAARPRISAIPTNCGGRDYLPAMRASMDPPKDESLLRARCARSSMSRFTPTGS